MAYEFTEFLTEAATDIQDFLAVLHALKNLGVVGLIAHIEIEEAEHAYAWVRELEKNIVKFRFLVIAGGIACLQFPRLCPSVGLLIIEPAQSGHWFNSPLPEDEHQPSPGVCCCIFPTALEPVALRSGCPCCTMVHLCSGYRLGGSDPAFDFRSF